MPLHGSRVPTEFPSPNYNVGNPLVQGLSLFWAPSLVRACTPGIAVRSHTYTPTISKLFV